MSIRAAEVVDGKVINVIVVESLDFKPNLVEAGNANIGDLYMSGTFTAPPITDAQHNACIDSQILALEEKVTQRRQREALLSGDYSFIADIDEQIAALRAQRM